jgi:hypothetical protein
LDACLVSLKTIINNFSFCWERSFYNCHHSRLPSYYTSLVYTIQLDECIHRERTHSPRNLLFMLREGNIALGRQHCIATQQHIVPWKNSHVLSVLFEHCWIISHVSLVYIYLV